MSDRNYMLSPEWPFLKDEPLPEPDAQASAEQLSNFVSSGPFEGVADNERVPTPGEWHGRPAWFRKIDGRLQVHMGPDALALADDLLPDGSGHHNGWKDVTSLAVPRQRGRGSSIEVQALTRAVVRAAIALQKEWEPHLLTLEGGPALNPSAFLSLMQATADYREATGD